MPPDTKGQMNPRLAVYSEIFTLTVCIRVLYSSPNHFAALFDFNAGNRSIQIGYAIRRLQRRGVANYLLKTGAGQRRIGLSAQD
jgi:hypothetical protein